MAKMFYTMKEAAEQLGVDQEKVQEMASNGELQQFRDRDKIMFKREQVDKLAGVEPAGGDEGESAEAPPQAEGDEPGATAIPLADSGDASAPTQPAGGAAQAGGEGDASEESPAGGLDVFEEEEVDAADPGAQTQVSQAPSEDEAGMDNVGSGSGLLDLTKESDDTSLGAELLDELGGEGEERGQAGGEEAGPAMEPMAPETEAPAGGGLADLGQQSAAPAGAAAGGPVAYEQDDPAGSGLASGLLLGAIIALALGLVLAVGAIGNIQTGLLQMMADSPMMLAMWCGGLLVLAIVFGAIGSAVGKSSK